MNLTRQEAVQSMRGVILQGPAEGKVRGVSIDSRTCKRGNLFIAIKGLSYDGHDFVTKAARRGVSCIVVSKKIRLNDKKITVIRVKDTVAALGDLASAYRKQFNIPVIAITGSTGKTTTKEMLAKVLSRKYQVLKNIKTQNNHIGVPLTLLRLKKSHDVAVLEFGTNRFGDIAWLTKVARPTVALYTNIGESHLQRLKTSQGVLREKIQLAQGMPAQAHVVYNNDDTKLQTIKKRVLNKKWITYAIDRSGKYRASRIFVNNRRLEFLLNGRTHLMLRTPVYHNIYNALGAIGVSRLFNIPMREIQKSLRGFQFPRGRSSVERTGHLLIIDDTYNANPLSFRSALGTLKNINTNKRKILICADMLELGDKAKQFHREIGKLASQSNIDLIVSTGPLASLITKSAKQHNRHVLVGHYDNLPALHQRLKGYCQEGDVILVKGSRGMHMERTIDFLGKIL